MLKNISQEITNQLDSFARLAPKLEELNKILEQQIVSDDLIEQYKSIPPAYKDAWVKSNIDKINFNIRQDLDDIMTDLISQMNVVFGSDQMVESLMAEQQQQNLQSAQKPQNKSYGIDQED